MIKLTKLFAAAILLLGSVSMQAQSASLTGKVIDEMGLPLIAVTVYDDGVPSNGTVTDMDGNYSLKLTSSKAVVVFSCLGYTELKENVAGRAVINVTLPEEKLALDAAEVVSVGYGSVTRRDLTGSVSKVDMGDMLKAPVTNFDQALTGKVAGVVVTTSDGALGAEANITIRGNNSLTQSSAPLYIIDGFPTESSMATALNSADIESIDILKDASATAIYGARGANGVIVITRKPIQESTLRVQYNFTGNFQLPVLSDYNVLSAAEKLEYERLAGLYDAKGEINATTGLPLQYEYDELYNQRYKLIAAGQSSDWLSQPARAALSHDHSLRVYGGASNLRYELTGRFGDTRGVMKGDFRKRNGVGFKLDYYIGNLTISNRTTYQEVAVKNSPYGSFSQYVQMNPYDRMYNDDGTPNTNLSWDLNNPLYEASLGSFSTSGERTLTNSTDLRWDISKMFLLTGHFNLTSGAGDSDIFTSPNSLVYKNVTDLSKKGSYVKGTTRNNSYNGNIVGTFNKFFKDESLVSLSAGWEINHSKSSAETLQVIGFFNDDMSYIGNAAGYPTDSKPFGSQAETADVGFFTTGNFSWRNRYFVDATWRTTGSSQFGENNRFGHFWSGGLGWNVMNEPFMKAVKKNFDVFKVRGSAGYTGKVTFSPFQAMTMYQYLNDYEYKNGIGAIPVTIGNVDLTWERTMNYNVGLDLSMFDRRLNFTVDAYIRNTEDLLLDKAKAPSTGVTSATSNLGELQNKGIEYQIDGYVFRTGDFYWRLATSGYMNRNKITKIDKALEEINKENQENADLYLTPLPQYAEGESVTALKLVRSAGIDPATGKEVYIKRNGEYTFEYDPADKVLIGDTEPAFAGTFSTNLYWKGFSVYALLNFRTGAWVYNTTRATKVEGADPMRNADQRVFDDRWKQPGDHALYKDIADTSRPEQTDRFAEKEHTLSLGSLNLSYEFSDKLCKRMKLRNLRAGINFTDILRLSTVKIELGTDYLYRQGFEFYLNVTL